MQPVRSLDLSRHLYHQTPDIQSLANHYAAQLRLCRTRIPNSHSLARTVHGNMITSGFKPRSHILNTLIDLYAKANKFSYAQNLFDEIPQPDVFARTTMLAAYASNGNIKHAKKVFGQIPVGMRDAVCYNALITGYARNNDGHGAIILFKEMMQSNLRPDNFTYTSLLSALRCIAEHEGDCEQLHCLVVKSGVEKSTSVLNSLLSLYVTCAYSPFVSSSALLEAARRLFDEMADRDDLTWTTMITGYVKNDDLNSASQIFELMSDRLVVVWNAMISGYVHHGFYSKAMSLCRKMRLEGIPLDEFTYTNILSACADAKLFKHGKEVHAYILRKGDRFLSDAAISIKNGLMTLYCKCCEVQKARHIFDEMPVRDLVSWNALLSGYMNSGQIGDARQLFSEMPEKNLLTWTVMVSAFAQHGCGEEGLKLINQMKSEGFMPCDYTFAGAITACAALGALEHGRQIHGQIVRFGYESSLSAGNALITMYARCGIVEAARCLFLTMRFVDSVSWNAMIAGLGQHGHGSEALQLYEQMLEQKILPDRITFLTVLTACSHAGLVKEGQQYFDSMYSSYGITPGEDHYARMTDLLCRAGKFSEAKELIGKMPFEPGAPIWEAFLAGCRIHGNLNLGIEAGERLLELIPNHDGTYVLLSNMYADAGHWDDVARVRKMMRERGVKKEPGCSWVEVESNVHVFLVDDAVHPEVRAVYDYLEGLEIKMRELGYVRETKHVRSIESDQKGYSSSTHSEKLAVAFGLMKLPVGATVRVFKNLRICGECHNTFKFMSKVVQREIIVRDGKRFHHFRDGRCSCGDYW